MGNLPLESASNWRGTEFPPSASYNGAVDNFIPIFSYSDD